MVSSCLFFLVIVQLPKSGSQHEKLCGKKRPFRNRGHLTILCKIITRMKLLFSNYLGDYITVFGGSSN